ncbi:MAG: insulinase family protein [Alistipes sp.]|nr:insulinase family protein [Alistipes sp.]
MKELPIKNVQPAIEIADAELVSLKNGMQLYLLPANEFAVMRLTLLFRAGSSRQSLPFSASATANLLAEGSEAMTAREISEQLDFHGSYFDVNTDRDYVYISFAMLSKFVPETLRVAEQLLLHPTFPEEEVETYRLKRKQRLQIERQKVDVRAREAFARAMFGADHPYGHSFEEAAYDQLTREELVAFYRRHYTASNGFAVCSGRIGDKERKALCALLEQLPAAEAAPRPEFPPICQERKVRLAHEGAVQSSIRIGRLLFPREHPDFVGMQVVAATLGGYFGSRLMQNLREQHGYTYGVISAMVNFEREGYLAIATQVGTEVTEEALKEIYYEIERLRHETMSDEELQLVKNIMTGEMMRILDGPFGIADVTIENILCGRTNRIITENVERIRSITPEEVQRLAEKYLRCEDLVTVVVG